MIPQTAKILTTAIALQASRSFLRDLRGLSSTREGEDFAKAIAEGAAAGLTPQDVVEEVVKAMGGNRGMALEILEAVQELAKAHVEQHTRTLANGKTVNVKAYESSRTAAMKATTMAHGATFHAMRAKSPEAHENAARQHEEAAKQHGQAHEVHPMDVPEVGQEHAHLKGQHQMAVDYHTNEAQRLRGEAAYTGHKSKAEQASQAVSSAYSTNQKVGAHERAAEAHKTAAAAKPGAGHEEEAEKHSILAEAHGADHKAGLSPLAWDHARGAGRATGEATSATQKAMQSGSREDHGKAAALHAAAAEHHMKLHGEHESDEDGHHGKVAQKHMKLHAYHSQKAEAAKEGATVAKAEGGPMTITPTTTDLAEKKGGEALAVEGRPGEEDEDAKGAAFTGTVGEIAKAQVAAHTRTVGGKVVQVSAYETHQSAAAHFSAQAHQGTAKSSAHGADGHGKTALAHKKAADAHREAAKYAPEDWMKKGHEDQAKLHDHYAQAHGKHAAAAGAKGDTGTDTPIHAQEHLTALEDHDDYRGFGYLGHTLRDAGTDRALVEAANKAGIDKHTLAAHLLSKSGRHMMDSMPGKSLLNEGGDGEHEERVAHFHRWLTSDKHNKTYGIKEYAKDLKNKDASAKGDSAGYKLADQINADLRNDPELKEDYAALDKFKAKNAAAQAKPGVAATHAAMVNPKGHGAIDAKKEALSAEAGKASAAAHKAGTKDAHEHAASLHAAAAAQHMDTDRIEHHTEMADLHKGRGVYIGHKQAAEASSASAESASKGANGADGHRAAAQAHKHAAWQHKEAAKHANSIGDEEAKKAHTAKSDYHTDKWEKHTESMESAG